MPEQLIHVVKRGRDREVGMPRDGRFQPRHFNRINPWDDRNRRRKADSIVLEQPVGHGERSIALRHSKTRPPGDLREVMRQLAEQAGVEIGGDEEQLLETLERSLARAASDPLDGSQQPTVAHAVIDHGHLEFSYMTMLSSRHVTSRRFALSAVAPLFNRGKRANAAKHAQRTQHREFALAHSGQCRA